MPQTRKNKKYQMKPEWLYKELSDKLNVMDLSEASSNKENESELRLLEKGDVEQLETAKSAMTDKDTVLKM